MEYDPTFNSFDGQVVSAEQETTLNTSEEYASGIAQMPILDNTTPPPPTTETPAPSKYTALPFTDSALMLATIDPNVRDQKFILHPWQVEESEKICRAKADSKHPFKYCLCAANGSGKDAFVIAPFAVWFMCCKIRSLVVITSSSGVQLSNQTENYIRIFSEKVNTWAKEHLGFEIIEIRQRHFSCKITGSEIFLFSTDEEGKAEGYHPFEPGSEMAIIVNEAKSVDPKIFRALRRCTGFTHWLNISTPGEPIGDFHASFDMWPNKRRITYYDCPHQSPVEFEEDRKVLGEHSALFRSKWLALFTFVGGKYVIGSASLDKLRRRVSKNLVRAIFKNLPLRVGVDLALSKNGDESVISAWRGNVQILQETTRTEDVIALANWVQNVFINKLRLGKNHAYIFIDDGGIGRAVIFVLKRNGWTSINRVLNQSPAKNKKLYGNRGAELWFKFSRLVEGTCLIPFNDDKLYTQLASRKFKESSAGIDKMTLEPKRDMIAAGLPSPDRADAAVLAFTDCRVEDFLDKIEASDDEESVKKTARRGLSDPAKVEEALWDMEFNAKTRKSDKPSRISLNALAKRQIRPKLF